MDKYMDSPMGPWARPMGPKMAAGPGPGTRTQGPWARDPDPRRHLWAHGPIGESIYLSICIHICPYVSIYTFFKAGGSGV